LFLNNVKSSISANCIDDNTAMPAIFKCKNKTKENSEAFDCNDFKRITNIIQAMENINISFIQQNILYYISGYIVRGLIKKIKCDDCIAILTNTNNKTYEHNYCSEIYSESSFMKFINRGKLYLPSAVVYNP